MRFPPPPRRRGQRGEFPTFRKSAIAWSNSRQVPEKSSKNRGFPFLSDFEPFRPFGGKPVNYLAPYWTQVSEENGTPLGVISDALLRVYFGSPVSLRHKYTLQRASEITPRVWCPIFFTSLRPIGCQVIHRFGPRWPKWPKITPRIVFFSRPCPPTNSEF